MSALEVESSVRYCEHLLYVQRSQRSMLCTLSQQFQQLQSCCDVVKGCEEGYLVPQVSSTLPYPILNLVFIGLPLPSLPKLTF